MIPPGVYPVLEHNPSLAAANWLAVTRAVAVLSGGDLLLTPPAGPASSGGFYRVRYHIVTGD